MTNYHRQLTTEFNVHLAKISKSHQCRKSLMSHGIWNPSLNMIEIICQHRSASKFFLTMGIMKNSKLYLYPEEAIFIMQCSLLQVSLNNRSNQDNIPLSLDEAYSLWFHDSLLSLKHLHVYQHLTRLGFILIRHRSSKAKAIESRTNQLNRTTVGLKRKLDDEADLEPIRLDENESQDTNHICQTHMSSECQRQWFPNYTDDPLIDMNLYPRLSFPDQFSPVMIDWLPSDFKEKVAAVQLSIYENRILSPRPSYSLLHSIDLQSHNTMYQRLSSLFARSTPTNSSSLSPSDIVFDAYTPRKNFRKSEPSLPDYQIRIKNGHDQFSFEDAYNEQQTKILTAVVCSGDTSFYLFKSFDPIEKLRLK